MVAPQSSVLRPQHSEGLADLTLAVRDGRTRLVRSLTRPPLLVQRALYLDEALPDMAFVYLANPTAGVFQGDTLRVAVRVCPGARAHVTTPAATKVYAMPDGAAHQETSLVVEEGAYLEYLPDPVIPFRGARWYQDMDITLAPGGTLIYGEVLAPGRLAMGESLAYTHYQTRLTLSRPDGAPLYAEAFSLAPGQRSPWGRGILGREGAAVLGTLLVVTEAVPASALRETLRQVCEAQGGVRAGVSVLPGGGGIGLKALAQEVAPVRAVLRQAWATVRQGILGVALPPLRKY